MHMTSEMSIVASLIHSAPKIAAPAHLLDTRSNSAVFSNTHLRNLRRNISNKSSPLRHC